MRQERGSRAWGWTRAQVWFGCGRRSGMTGGVHKAVIVRERRWKRDVGPAQKWAKSESLGSKKKINKTERERLSDSNKHI